MENRRENSIYKSTQDHWEQQLQKGWGEGMEPEPQFLSFVEKHGEEIGPKILDIGSGDGRHLLPLVKAGYEVTGTDFTDSGILATKDKLTKEGLIADLVKADFRELPFKENSFDSVISIQAIHHNNWDGAKKSFAEASRVLKSGGLFFLRVTSSTRTIDDNWTKLDESLGPDLPPEDRGQAYSEISKQTGEERIIRTFSLEELKLLAAENSLKIVDEPIDEKQKGVKGHWNITFRKKAKIS